MENDEVECEGQSHGGDQPQVAPWGHGDEGLVLRQAATQTEISFMEGRMRKWHLSPASCQTLPVHGVQHLNGDKHRQSHGHGVRVVEDLAVQALELLATTNAGQVVSLGKPRVRE